MYELGTAITLLQDIPVGSYYEKLVPAGSIILEDSGNIRKQSLNGGRRELLFLSSFEGYTGYVVSSSLCFLSATSCLVLHHTLLPATTMLCSGPWSQVVMDSKTISAIYIIQFITVGGRNQ